VLLAAAAQATSAGAKSLGSREEISLYLPEDFAWGIAKTLQLAATPTSASAPLPTPCADGHRWGEPDLEHAAELMQQVAAGDGGRS